MAQELSAEDARALKKAAKKEKRRLEKAAAATMTGNGASFADGGGNNEVTVDNDEDSEKLQRKKAKLERKEKKRKLKELGGDDGPSGTATAESTPGLTEEASNSTDPSTGLSTPLLDATAASTSSLNGNAAEDKPKKSKKRKVQGAFGNDMKKQKEEQTAASTASNVASTSSSSPTLSSAEIQAFIKESELSYEPSGSASTYPPVLSFDTLPVVSGIKAGLTRFTKPTIVQSASWGVQLPKHSSRRGRDCVAIASTGSGKTLAFGIPILHHILNLPSSSKNHIAALVVAPTRELAMQTQTNLGDISESLGMGIVCIYGGASKEEQKRLLKKKPRIVVGTPGRIIDLMNEGALELNHVSWLVLDEADRMLDKGFENDIRAIIGQCKPSNASVDGRVTSMFSATWPVSVRRLANDFMADPVRITVGSDELSANVRVKQTVMVLQDRREKNGKLLDVLRAEGFPASQNNRFGDRATNKKRSGPATGAEREKVLVFALYKAEASRVHQWLESKGYEVGVIQGDLSQDQRTKALENFRTGVTGMLVATDVAARGLDIPKVELVVNYTFPLTVEDYVHRIGRTGRAGRDGQSITFFTEDEKALAGELQRVLKDAGQDVPDALAAFGGTIKKKSHAAYGDHFKEVDMTAKATKIKFD